MINPKQTRNRKENLQLYKRYLQKFFKKGANNIINRGNLNGFSLKLRMQQ